MSIKKDFFAPLALGLGAMRRAEMLLLVMMLTMTQTAWATDVTLSGSDNYTAQDGDVLTGSTSGTVTIAADAKITLSGVTITGGIVCEGSATITLVGENDVKVTSLASSLIYKTPGIKIGGTGTTLTIKGDGSLTATGGSQAAGIGLGRTWDANATGGSIVIESGNITASGDIGIGIGTVGNSKTASLDGIIIKGGTINASLGSGYIYNLSSVTIGAIKIYDAIDKVDASKITESVTYMHVQNEAETNVTASASDYFTIIEDGDRRIIEKKDDTDYTITIVDGIEHGSIAYAATTAKYGEKITITATPNFGYRLSCLVVKDAENNDVATTGNSFFMPKGDVTVSAVFEQGVHGTTEFAWGYFGPDDFVTEATIYDGLTTVNLQQGQSYKILKYDDEYSYRHFLLDNNTTYNVTIPYSGGTGTFTYVNGTYFKVDYNGEEGFYDITMTDVGNDKWSISIQKTVPVVADIPDQEYTGSEITPEPLVMAGSLNLTKGTDYVYSYTDNTDVGTATVTVTFKGDYASLGSVEKEFTIVPKSVTNNDITVTIESKTWTGNELTPVIIVKDGETTLTLNEDYTVTAPNGPIQDAGNYTYTINGMGNYAGSKEATFTILPSTVIVNVTGNGTVTYNDKSAASGETIGVTAEKGTDVTLTLTPGNGYAVRSVEYGYTNSNEVTMNGAKLPINGTTATLTVPNDLKDGTYVNLTVTFVSALVGGADEASAVALTDNTVTNFAGGWYKVDSDITFDHTLNLLGDTYLIIDDGKTMTVNTASNRGIYSDYTLFVSGDGALSVTTTAGYGIAVCVGNYVQTGATVTASGYIGIRCMDDFIAFNFDNDFTFSGGQLTATGSGGAGMWADNAITLGWTNPDDRITASSYDASGTVKVADGKTLWNGSETLSGTITDLTKVNGKTLMGVDILLDDDRDANVKNSQRIAALNGQQANVVLNGCTLYKDGSWNTLCLPFDVDLTATDCPLYGATARSLTAASVSGTTLNLTFGDAVNTLEAGTPYIIKWDGDGTSNIENPVFEGVTIEATKHDYDTNAKSVTTDERVRFVGTYKSTAFDSEDKSILLMGEENTLFYPAEGAGIGSFRAYFKIGGDDSALLARRLTAFSIDFGEDEEEATGIINVSAETRNNADGWYSLDGRKLVGKPTQNGIYINNGKKVVIK